MAVSALAVSVSAPLLHPKAGLDARSHIFKARGGDTPSIPTHRPARAIVSSCLKTKQTKIHNTFKDNGIREHCRDKRS